MKKFICIMLIVLCLLPTGAAAESNFTKSNTYPDAFADVAKDAWYAESVKSVYEYGLMYGVSDTAFAPDDTMSVAQMITIAARLRSICYADGEDFEGDGEWYTPYVDYAAAHGIIKENKYRQFDAPATRIDFCRAIYYALPAEMFEPKNLVDYGTIPDLNQTDDGAFEVYALYRAGILVGVDEAGTLKKRDSISRAQVAAIVTRAVDESLRTSITLKDDDSDADSQTSVLINGKKIYIGMSKAELEEVLGECDEVLLSVYDVEWHVYNTDSYEGLVAVGVDGRNCVKIIACEGLGWEAAGYAPGDVADENTFSNFGIETVLYADKNDSNKLHGVMLWSGERHAEYTQDRLDDESVLLFHFTNAFRVMHSLKPLSWSQPAVESAKLHSLDMAERDFFEHTNLDGQTPFDRMKAQGIQYRSAAENINAGYYNALESISGWINSIGHRTNILGDYRYIGIGAGYSDDSHYRIYWAQNFWS